MGDLVRCPWCLKDDLYKHYHDNIWGKPEYDENKLFEYLNLEGAQAGLTWYTILVKMEGYRKAFCHWDAEKIVKLSEKQISLLENNPEIIRNKLKIRATISNAKAFLDMKSSGQDFSEYIWSFVDGQPKINQFKSMAEVPASTEISRRLSKSLKSNGFKFVGPTIAYAFMQAVGMVNDHLIDCHFR